MDTLVAYGSDSEESDNGGEQQEQKQASHGKGDISREIPVLETSTITTMDEQSSRVPLPLELNCEIFKCLKLPNQRKFIWGLGRDIYGMFGQKLLKKTKRVCTGWNLWNRTTTDAIVYRDGLHARNSNIRRVTNIYAEKGFAISGKHSRADSFPGTIIYYYEVKLFTEFLSMVGLSDGTPKDDCIGEYPNSYAITTDRYYLDQCWLAEEKHQFEFPEGAIQPRLKFCKNVFGCGLVMDPEDKLWIFFTLNDQLMGRKILINPTVDHLFPTVTMLMTESFEANFGDDSAKPFEYDIKNCPALGLACI